MAEIKDAEVYRNVARHIIGASDWTVQGIISLLFNLRFVQLKGSGSRTTFADSEGVRYSVYSKHASFERLEITTDIEYDTEQLSVDQYDQVLRDFRCRFLIALSAINDVLGEALDPGDKLSELLEDEDALLIAHWKLKDVSAVLTLKHEDREVPMRICITVRGSLREPPLH